MNFDNWIEDNYTQIFSDLDPDKIMDGQTSIYTFEKRLKLWFHSAYAQGAVDRGTLRLR